MRYYREFLAQRGHDPALRADAAEASLRVGLITTESGDKREALTALEEARTLLIAIAGDRPGDLGILEKLGMCHDMIASMHQQLGQSNEAIDAHIRGADVYKKLVAAEPKNPRWRRILSHAVGNLANTYFLAGRKDDCQRAYRELKAAQEELVRLAPRNVAYRKDLSTTLNNLALGISSDERFSLLRDALKLRRELAAEAPKDAVASRDVARTLYNLVQHTRLTSDLPMRCHSTPRPANCSRT